MVPVIYAWWFGKGVTLVVHPCQMVDWILIGMAYLKGNGSLVWKSIYGVSREFLR